MLVACLTATLLIVAPQVATLPPLAPGFDVELRRALGGDPAGVLSALFAPGRHANAERRLADLPLETRVHLARWGLRSADPAVALGAAAIAKPAWLDLAETRRLVEVGIDRALLLPAPFSFEDFRDSLGYDDVGRMLLSCPPVPREVYQLVGLVHRSVRPAHIPALCQLTRCDDVLLREDALRFLVVASWYSDQHRTQVADAVLVWPGEGVPEGVDPTEEKVPFVPRAFTLPDDHGGWPPLLQAVLQRLFVEPVDGELRKFRAWALRWALDARPGDGDLDLLARLEASEDPRARSVAARRLIERANPAVTARLRALAEDDEDLPAVVALAALASRGDGATMRAELWARAQRSEYALAAFLNLGDAAITEVCALAFGDDQDAGRALLVRLADARRLDRIGLVPIPAKLPARLAAAATTRPLDDVRLHALLDAWPETRTLALRRAYLAALTPTHLPDCAVALLEVTDHIAFTTKVDACRDHADRKVALAAHDLLLRLGSPARGLALLAFCAEQGELPIALARSQSPALLAALRAAIADLPTPHAAAALATTLACFGLDERLAESLANEWAAVPPELLEAWPELRVAATSGDAGAAVAAYLAGRPLSRGRCEHLFRLRHPAVDAYLARCRHERHHGLYAWATAEAGLAGDATALAEVRAAQRAGIYPWLDDLPAYALADDGELTAIPSLLEHLEGNCCTYAAVASRLEDLVEWDGFAAPDDGLRSRPAIARAYFAAHAAHTVVSTLTRTRVVVR